MHEERVSDAPSRECFRISDDAILEKGKARKGIGEREGQKRATARRGGAAARRKGDGEECEHDEEVLEVMQKLH
eukprot:2387602-Pleurochrysis_carterae.AAC.1